MKIVYTDANRVDQGFLSNCSLDLEIGMYDKGSNDFEITVDYQSWDPVLNVGSLIYCEDTEYGGVITGVESDTGNGQIVLSGMCPRALLSQIVIGPTNRSSPYYSFAGEANEAIRNFINNRITFFSFDGNKTKYVNINSPISKLFEISNEDSGFDINYQVRYADTFYSIETMLMEVGAKVDLKWKLGRVYLKVVPIFDYSGQTQLDNSYGLSFIARRKIDSPNHLIVLGTGELENRIVLNIFKTDNGEYFELTDIGGKNQIPGQLNSAIYDYKTNEGLLDLKEKAISKLKSMQREDTLDISLDELEANVGDIVGGYESITGISMKKSVTRVVLKSSLYKNSSIESIEYKVGD